MGRNCRPRSRPDGLEAPDQLLANPSNWRIHGKAQRKALQEVLDTVGYVAGVIVNQRTGHLVDDHLRVEEALSHGQPTIPVLYVDLSEEEERLVLASLDPLAAMATTDEAKLRELLAEVSVDAAALAAMLAALAPTEPKDGLTDPDDVPEPPDEAVTKPGDLWLLGEHRLLCGDAGSEADLDRLLDGVTVDLLLTDPPYNVRVEPRSNNAIAAGMAASYDASHQEALEGSKRRRTVKALDNWPPVVDTALARRAHDRRAALATNTGRRAAAKRPYALTMLHCADCGIRLTGDTGYYRHPAPCPSFVAAKPDLPPRPGRTHGKAYRRGLYEDVVGEILSEVSLNADLVTWVVGEVTPSRRGP